MAGPRDMLSLLRGPAQQAIARNAVALDGGAPTTLEDRAKRWWDFPAKHELSYRIHDDELRRSIEEARAAGLPNAHNNRFDAMRHARWSQRSAQATGPLFTAAAGVGNELDNLRQSIEAHHGVQGPYDHSHVPTPGETLDEMGMDMHNNLKGLKAALSGHPIDPRQLKSFPTQPGYAPLYRSPPAGLEGLPRR